MLDNCLISNSNRFFQMLQMCICLQGRKEGKKTLCPFLIRNYLKEISLKETVHVSGLFQNLINILESPGGVFSDSLKK